MTSISASLSASVSWQSLAPASTSSAVTAAPALSRDRAFTTFASTILAALGASGTASDPGASTGGAGGRVGDVALALQNALENPSASGDVVGGLISTVQSALAQASKALSDAGYSGDQIQAFATQFSNALSDQLNTLANQAAAAAPTPAPVTTAPVAAVTPAITPAPVSTPAPTPVATPVATTTATPATTPAATSPATPPPAASAPASTAAPGSGAFEASFRQTESGALQLLTTQGDVVTINFRNSTGGSVVGASANAAAGLAAYAAVGSYASTRFSVSVQGSLNADEVKAINDVLGQVNALATQFFSGNLTQAFASAVALGADPKEIAGFALHLTERTSISLASVGDGSAPSPTDAAAPASAAPAIPAPTAVPPAAAPPAIAPVTATAGSAGATTPPATSSSVGGGISSLLDYLQQVFDALGTTTTAGSVTFSAKAKIELLASTVGAASITPQESTAAALLKNIAAATTDTTAPSATPAASTPASAGA